MKRTTVTIFKALGDPNRIRIIKMLEVRELCVCEVREVLGLATATVSRHLAILREAGLITDSKSGKWVNYRLAETSASPLVRAQLALVRKSFADDEHVIADRKVLKTVDRNSICSI
jgi:ArsR family transcriptional regulator, arsenate/arsenite/antimonite-responsive transcriptional repressor